MVVKSDWTKADTELGCCGCTILQRNFLATSVLIILGLVSEIKSVEES